MSRKIRRPGHQRRHRGSAEVVGESKKVLQKAGKYIFERVKFMKSSIIGYTRLVRRIYLFLLGAVLSMVMPVFGLYMPGMSKNIQTKVQEPRERTISLKLPLLQPAFHWTFMSREDFLSGKLILRIVRNGRSFEIVIFENGQFHDGWEAMPLPEAPGRGEIYFGFISTRKYLTAPGDKLELELTVAKDLLGIGAIETGILPAGKYTSKGTYSGLIDEYDTMPWGKELSKEGMPPEEQQALLDKLRAMCEYKAFLESWTDQWPLMITSEKGWLPDEQASAVKTMLEKLGVQAQSPAVSTDSVVANENLFRKYIWFWIAILPVVLFIVIFLRRAFVRK